MIKNCGNLKTLNGEYDNKQTPVLIEKDGDILTLTGKVVENILIGLYEAVGGIELSSKKKKKKKKIKK